MSDPNKLFKVCYVALQNGIEPFLWGDIIPRDLEALARQWTHDGVACVHVGKRVSCAVDEADRPFDNGVLSEFFLWIDREIESCISPEMKNVILYVREKLTDIVGKHQLRRSYSQGSHRYAPGFQPDVSPREDAYAKISNKDSDTED